MSVMRQRGKVGRFCCVSQVAKNYMALSWISDFKSIPYFYNPWGVLDGSLLPSIRYVHSCSELCVYLYLLMNF